MERNKRNGKLHLLPRVESPYRKINIKVVLIITWISLLFATAGSVSAAEAPVTPTDILNPTTSAPTATSSAKTDLTFLTSPVTKDSSLTTLQADPTAASDAPAAQNIDSPEIKMEIQSAEYVPPTPAPTPVPAQRKSVTVSWTAPTGGAWENHFSFGYCTWYVASQRYIPWFGNAGSWLYEAQAYGFPTGSAARPGSIMVSYEGSSAGHVAYVESVNPDGSYTVSEMNFNGNFGRVTSRTITPGTTDVIGFIY